MKYYGGVMPELPDIVAYIDALRPRVVGRVLKRVRVRSAFLVRSVEPPISEIEGREVDDLRRLGKRIVFCMSDDLYLVFHLMIADRFPGPGDITAFREGFAVHGRFGERCPKCGSTVQRIRYAENETNYCPKCQTDGRILADRSLSRLLKDDWGKRV